jgi:hypothetical protein
MNGSTRREVDHEAQVNGRRGPSVSQVGGALALTAVDRGYPLNALIRGATAGPARDQRGTAPQRPTQRWPSEHTFARPMCVDKALATTREEIIPTKIAGGDG